MLKSSVCLAALSAGAALALASAAQAGTVYNGTLAGPVYYGTGNAYTPENFAITTENGIEIALRSHVRLQAAPASIGDTYALPTGAPGFNFDFSYDPTHAIGDLSNIVASIRIDNLGNGATYSFDPTLISDNSHLGGGYQNSERGIFFNGGFPGSALGYDVNANDTFKVTYSLSGVPNVGAMSVTNTIQIGAGVPEPASWALMIVGFGGAGVALRRSRKTAATATA